MYQLKGIVPPVVTPLLEDESIDEAGLERQLERLIKAGVHGIYFLGTTGEQPALRDNERVRAIRAAIRIVAGRVPVTVGVMASSSARAIDNIRVAESAGADAVAVTPPHYYNSGGPADQIAHYEACARATSLPVVIYNIPSTTKVMIAPETMSRIGEVANIAGIKDSSGDFSHFLRILALLRNRADLGLLIGAPALAGAAILYGADGSVPGIANLDPNTMLEVYDNALRGDIAGLRVVQDRVHKLMALTTFGAPIACLKTALEVMGVCRHFATAPIQPLSDEKRQMLRGALADLGLV